MVGWEVKTGTIKIDIIQDPSMRILFLVYHGFSEYSGISKKIRYQVKGLRENGHDVRLCYYDYAENGHRCRYIDGKVLKDYGKGRLAGLRQRLDYNCVYDYCVRKHIEFVYARSCQNATPWLISFFKRLQHSGIRVVTEIPTYPYDGEFSPKIRKQPLRFIFDKWFRHRLSRYMDAIVTFSDAHEIFGKRTINISNGVDFDSIPLHSSDRPKDSSLHLIAVAEVNIWHGFDRVITGLGEYYLHARQPRQVFFHIVGGVWSGHMKGKRGFRTLIDKYHLQERVFLHGPLFGQQLDDMFNQCQFAVGSLGRHRSGITAIKTLKNREYATRGLPFIYSEQDSDFEHQPYIIKAPADETPIDIQQIIDFLDHFTMKSEEIRKTVTQLAWKIQMQRVIDAVL
jgi:glycosyltransferase involved in cell wall biosynthesis